MACDHRVEFVLVLLFLTMLTVLIALTGADLNIASRFYQNGGWPVGEQHFWKLLYRIEGYPAYAVALFGLGVACYGGFRSPTRLWRRRGVFLVMLLALGPGLLVNGILKKNWGRPRPRQIVEFGGSRQYQHPWQPDFDTGEGRSFPSGHGAAAFYLTAPFFIHRRSNPKLARRWLSVGLCFGLLMSFARIAQGGHFLSDVLWSWGLVHLTALPLSSLLLSVRDGNDSPFFWVSCAIRPGVNAAE